MSEVARQSWLSLILFFFKHLFIKLYYTKINHLGPNILKIHNSYICLYNIIFLHDFEKYSISQSSGSLSSLLEWMLYRHKRVFPTHCNVCVVHYLCVHSRNAVRVRMRCCQWHKLSKRCFKGRFHGKHCQNRLKLEQNNAGGNMR